MNKWITALAASCIATTAIGDVYFNEEEQARYDTIIEPFVSGSVSPMSPTNYEPTSQCERPELAAEWRRQFREDFWPGVNHLLNIYSYNQHLNVLESRDCSCVGKMPPAEPTAELFEELPTSETSGFKVGANFYSDKLRTLKPLVRAFCGDGGI